MNVFLRNLEAIPIKSNIKGDNTPISQFLWEPSDDQTAKLPPVMEVGI